MPKTLQKTAPGPASALARTGKFAKGVGKSLGDPKVKAPTVKTKGALPKVTPPAVEGRPELDPPNLTPAPDPLGTVLMGGDVELFPAFGADLSSVKLRPATITPGGTAPQVDAGEVSIDPDSISFTQVELALAFLRTERPELLDAAAELIDATGAATDAVFGVLSDRGIPYIDALILRAGQVPQAAGRDVVRLLAALSSGQDRSTSAVAEAASGARDATTAVSSALVDAIVLRFGDLPRSVIEELMGLLGTAPSLVGATLDGNLPVIGTPGLGPPGLGTPPENPVLGSPVLGSPAPGSLIPTNPGTGVAPLDTLTLRTGGIPQAVVAEGIALAGQGAGGFDPTAGALVIPTPAALVGMSALDGLPGG